MKRLAAGLLLFFHISQSAQYEIADFTQAENRCDYLMVSPAVYAEQASRLVEHRNSFQFDDVENARLVDLNQLIEQFKTHDTTSPHEALWYAFKYAASTWQQPPKYIVLVGSDSINWDSTRTRLVSYGLTPSFPNGYMLYYSVRMDTFVQYTDDYYLTIDKSSPFPAASPKYNLDLSIGRIPCENADQLRNYIDKVIRYDLTGQRGTRNNRALVLADDIKQVTSADPLGFSHFTTAENTLKQTSLKDYELSKVYLSMYRVNEFYIHQEAKQVFWDQVNRGTKYVVFFGHGCPAYITDEKTVQGSDVSVLGSHAEPFFFFSFSCSNGAYHHPYNESMAKQFLFNQGGGTLAFFASSMLEYSYPSQVLSHYLFKVADSIPDMSVGRMVTLAKRNCSTMGIQYYHVLGDPALRINNRRLRPEMTIDGRLIRVKIPEADFSSGNYYLTVSTVDTSKLLDDTSRTFLSNRVLSSREQFGAREVVFDLSDIPQQFVKLNLYVSGELQEGRADTIFFLEGISPVLPPVARTRQDFSITSRTGQLTVRVPGNSEGKVFAMAIYDLRGRKIFEGSFLEQVFSLDFRQAGISSGRYLVKLSEGKKTVFRRAMILIQ